MGDRLNDGHGNTIIKRIDWVLDHLGFTKEAREAIGTKVRGFPGTLRELMRLRCVRTLCVMCIAMIATTYILLPGHWFYLIWGFVALAVGPILNEWANKWRADKKFLGVAFISVAVAIGGLLSTLVWNDLTNLREDREMLVAVATEWIIMDACIDHTRKVIERVIADDSAPALPIMVIPHLPESGSAATHCAIIRQDPTLKHALTVYVMGVMQFNNAYQHLMQATYMPNRDKAYRRGLLTSFLKRDGPFDYLATCHRYLGDYLKEEYPRTMHAAERQADKEYLDAIKAREFVPPTIQDASLPKEERQELPSL